MESKETVEVVTMEVVMVGEKEGGVVGKVMS
jgi:hypothetical protein